MNTYADALNKAQEELAEMIRKREECDRRIVALETTITALSSLSDSVDRPIVNILPNVDLRGARGISDAIRFILQESTAPMTAPLIRDTLVNAGFATERYASVLAVIHNTVKRMDDQGEILKVHRAGRFMGWRYQRPAFDQRAGRPGTDPKPNSAYECGMRGDEKP